MNKENNPRKSPSRLDPPVMRETAPDGSLDGESMLGRIWLDGGVLACACPDCGAPMSIRLWLKLADCWRCGASVELTEEQEAEAIRL
ncbi:MAG TPA: hypothetical protein PLO20_13585, partial [Thermogutta sp.]|nr:hypothetical protein [Thermogutta sp.]